MKIRRLMSRPDASTNFTIPAESTAQARLMRIDGGFHRDKALDDLVAPHLHCEDANPRAKFGGI